MSKFVCKDCGKTATKNQVKSQGESFPCIYRACGGVMVEVPDNYSYNITKESLVVRKD